MSKYEELDFCLNLLFDFAYGKTSQCYELNYESKKDVPIEYLKFDDSFDPSSIFKEKISFEGMLEDKFVFKRHSKSGYSSMMRIGIYNDELDAVNLNSKELIDMKHNYIFSELALNDNHYKFILLPIYNFDIKFKDLKDSNPEITDILNKDKKIKDDTLLYIQIFEHYFKQRPLKKYLEENYKNFSETRWKVLCFQVLYGLAKLQKSYPKFRHNKMNLDSIYVYEKEEILTDSLIKLDEYKFKIPNPGFEIKMTNFYHSNIDGISNNKETLLKEENQFYDVHYFLSSLHYFLKDHNINIPNLTAFINNIVPDKILSKDKNNIGLNEEYYRENIETILNPYRIITKNNFFTNLIKENMNSMTSSSSNNLSDKSKYEMQESSIDYLLSSSMTETGSGARPSMLAKSKKSNKKDSYISGTRKLARQNMRGGARAKSIDQYGNMVTGNDEDSMDTSEEVSDIELSSTSDEKMSTVRKMPLSETSDEEEEPTEDSDKEDEDEEEEKSEEEVDEEEEESEESDESNDMDLSSEPETDKPSTTGMGSIFGKMVDKSKKPMTKEQITRYNNGLFKGIEKLAEKNKVEEMTKSLSESSYKKKSDSKGKKKGKKGKKGKNSKESELLKRLPENYEGILPDYMQNMLPPPSMPTQGMDMGQNMQMSEMGNLSQIMQPPQPMPGNFNPQQFSEGFSQQPVNSNKQNMFDNMSTLNLSIPEISAGPDHSQMLPDHLLMDGAMNNQSGNMPPNMTPNMPPNMNPNPFQASQMSDIFAAQKMSEGSVNHPDMMQYASIRDSDMRMPASQGFSDMSAAMSQGSLGQSQQNNMLSQMSNPMSQGMPMTGGKYKKNKRKNNDFFF